MNRKFISHSNFVLRKILNSKENLDIIQDFIETFLEEKIKEIKLNPYLESKNLPSRENFGIVDVRVKFNNNEEMNIGIQFIDGCLENVQNKILLYYAQIHTNQLKYNDCRKVVKTKTINILDFNYFNCNTYEQNLVITSNPDENGNFQKIELHILELSKFNILKENKINNKVAWMTFLSGKDIEELNSVTKKFEKIRKLDELLGEYWKNETMQ